MKTQPPPEPHAQLPQAGEGLQVQEAGFTFGRTQPQQGQETLAGAQEVGGEGRQGGERERRRREGKTSLRVLNNDRRDRIFKETRQENLLNNSDYEHGPGQRLIGAP